MAATSGGAGRSARDAIVGLVLPLVVGVSVLLGAHRFGWSAWVEGAAWVAVVGASFAHLTRRRALIGSEAARGRETDRQAASAVETQPSSSDEVAVHRDRLATLGELVCGITHELNNPLAAVCGFADLLRDREDLDRSTRDQIESLHTQADRCRHLVENLLRFARRQTPRRERLDLDQVVSQSLMLMEGPLRTGGINVLFDPNGGLPPVTADAFEVQQVIVNILTNAAQALAPQQTGLVRLQTGLSPRGEVIVRITDNGPGMPPETLARIFDPFFTTKGSDGTGLGLSLSRAIIERHGGQLTAESRPGRGTTFQIALPAGERSAPPPSVSESPGVHPLRVLIVDDEPMIIDLLAQLLVSEGHGVITCADGREALERLADDRVDVVLSDLCMPDLSGAELHEAIRSRWPDLAGRMAFITGDLLNPELTTLSEETGCPLIAKPFQRAEIRRVLAELGAPGRRAEPAAPAH